MLRIITDFDGPIMDVSERYYRVYQFCLEQTQQVNQPIQKLSKAEFWRLKRSRVPEWQIGLLSGLTDEQAEAFASLRRRTVHTLPYLVHDQLVPQAVDALLEAQALGIDLAVMTMRRVSELQEAFSRYSLERFFPPERRYCLANDYVKTGDVKDKPLLMKRALAELPPASQTWMIGDTEADLVAAKLHKIPCVGVLSGIRDRASLEAYQPDAIASNLFQALRLIQAQVATPQLDPISR
ncbi:HAD family hydrolase [Desertifilum sp. FACHB-1129]|uniref:Haloacid dehalogenase n=1 Tax=Desertifilum tharense IPPAS B-1220 TaxID=1781255 RepID=A0A1E5QR54_9CYAN|nr:MULTISPECIES: HAD family hydrolase [Desertifilum]MDA0209183.1 HAD family hydrolase [Cyanobacteria bacterium FC1]MBD2311837.1 HAD family hydrolase [Desertifilum sp. FACHB-1129]MBD2322981.1 HAD family hydrolase [Desertifilum sp. FACHB-866]MBD2333412.1 HAD family hydrolase [Desertifilum sp. FACHB-868]OEJ76823.1 haloacid dehalogenase [Desertifilum tharense IPPAS B-1220]